MCDVKFLAIVICVILPFAVIAQDRDFTLSAPAEIVETGFLKYLLPRFSLKHSVRVTQVENGGEITIGTDGVPAFSGLGQVWRITRSDAAGPELFMGWLQSDIGQRTIAGFQPNGTSLFTAEIAAKAATPELVLEGDPVAGEALSMLHCGRCHVINESNRMKGMGQTPSFALMRTFPDWQTRFGRFYTLNPHPSFSQVENVTPPFSDQLPPAIVPVKITEGELQAILAYVATIAPADLGAPLQVQ